MQFTQAVKTQSPQTGHLDSNMFKNMEVEMKFKSQSPQTGHMDSNKT